MNNMGRHLRLQSIYSVLWLNDIMVIMGVSPMDVENPLDEYFIHMPSTPLNELGDK